MALAFAWPSCATAEIYKWVDQKGVTNYSSAPPATGKARTLDPETVTVSVYQAPPPQEAARALDAMMRQRVAMLENQLRAERLARQTHQASTQLESDRGQLAYEQCLRDRRVDCDRMRDGLYASNPYPYVGSYVTRPYYVAAAPVLVAGRTVSYPQVRSAHPRPAYLGAGAISHFAGGSPRAAGRPGLSRQVR
jgi:hypothetical protein